MNPHASDDIISVHPWHRLFASEPAMPQAIHPPGHGAVRQLHR
ncbi:MAG TPA: hypothetical protein VGC09_09160 [Rhodopila sp.]